jgi:hypothetical protein
VLTPKQFGLLLRLLSEGDYQLRRELAWFFVNIFGESTPEQREAIIRPVVMGTMFEFVEASEDGELRQPILFVL